MQEGENHQSPPLERPCHPVMCPGTCCQSSDVLNPFVLKHKYICLNFFLFRHMNTIELQLEVTRFLHRCETASSSGAPAAIKPHSKSSNSPPTLFGGSPMKIEVACKVKPDVIHASKVKKICLLNHCLFCTCCFAGDAWRKKH